MFSSDAISNIFRVLLSTTLYHENNVSVFNGGSCNIFPSQVNYGNNTKIQLPSIIYLIHTSTQLICYTQLLTMKGDNIICNVALGSLFNKIPIRLIRCSVFLNAHGLHNVHLERGEPRLKRYSADKTKAYVAYVN